MLTLCLTKCPTRLNYYECDNVQQTHQLVWFSILACSACLIGHYADKMVTNNVAYVKRFNGNSTIIVVVFKYFIIFIWASVPVIRYAIFDPYKTSVSLCLEISRFGGNASLKLFFQTCICSKPG